MDRRKQFKFINLSETRSGKVHPKLKLVEAKSGKYYKGIDMEFNCFILEDL